MANIIELARKGQRSALADLYQTHKQKVFFLAACLLKDPVQVENATVAVFRESWNSLRTEQIHTQQQFAAHIVCKTVNYCKAKLYQKNPKALRLPFNKDFSIPANTLVRDNSDTAAQYYLGNLPVLQRYIFAMHIVGELEVLQIGRILKFDAKTVNLALDAEQENWNRLKKLSGKGYTESYDELIQELREAETDQVVPGTVDQQISAIIDDIAKPVEEKERKAKYRICVLSTLILASTLIVCLIIGLQDGNTTTGSDETHNTTQSADATGETEATEPQGTEDLLMRRISR